MPSQGIVYVQRLSPCCDIPFTQRLGVIQRLSFLERWCGEIKSPDLHEIITGYRQGQIDHCKYHPPWPNFTEIYLNTDIVKCMVKVFLHSIGHDD